MMNKYIKTILLINKHQSILNHGFINKNNINYYSTRSNRVIIFCGRNIAELAENLTNEKRTKAIWLPAIVFRKHVLIRRNADIQRIYYI